MYGAAYGLRYLLDPRYLGQHLLPRVRCNLEELLVKTPADVITPVDDDQTATHEQVASAFRFKLLQRGSKTILQYWLIDGHQWPELRKIAVKLFSIAASTASSERNFSTMGFIHSKLRNALRQGSVEKLVFIKSNLPAFYDHQQPEDDKCSNTSC